MVVMMMRGWQAAIRRTGVVMVLLVGLAGIRSGASGAALAHAPAASDVVEVASSQYGVTINDGAASASSLDVTLTMRPLPGAVRMRISNSSELAGSVWEPVAARKAWRLTPPGPSGAPVTVSVQFGNHNGDVSAVYRDDIVVGERALGRATTSPTALVTPPAGVPMAAPDCSPRPRVTVSSERAIGIPEVGGALLVTVSATGNGNYVQAIRFDGFTNALVAVDGPDRQAAPFAYTVPASQQVTQLQFAMWKQTPGQAATVRLTVVDGCGEWSTFVGGGPSAF